MKLLLTPKAYLKLKYYVLGCEDEISGIGQTRYINEDTIQVKDVVIFKQDVSGASTDLDKDEVAKFIAKKLKEGADTSTWNLWWHSHADMSVFWSSTDEETINSFLSDHYIVSLVSNHKLEFKARIDIFKPFRVAIEDDIIVEVEIDEDIKLLKKITDEIEEKISKGWSSKTETEPTTEITTTTLDDALTEAEDRELERLETKLMNEYLTANESARYQYLTEKSWQEEYNYHLGGYSPETTKALGKRGYVRQDEFLKGRANQPSFNRRKKREVINM